VITFSKEKAKEFFSKFGQVLLVGEVFGTNGVVRFKEAASNRQQINNQQTTPHNCQSWSTTNPSSLQVVWIGNLEAASAAAAVAALAEGCIYIAGAASQFAL